MNLKPSISKRAIRITTALALLTVTSVIAVSLLMTDAGGATAFNAGASDTTTRHVPIPAQYTAQCYNGIAVPNPADNPGLVTDCATLLASKGAIEGTDGYLNWSADVRISGWRGVTIANNRVSKLKLDNHLLNGRIPSELGNLSNLTDLDLSDNQLTGGIPAELANLANLGNLRLFHNQLTGAIPAELGGLTYLSQLYLGGNQLTGGIPVELGNLAYLYDLGLSNNQLTGAIPVELGNLPNLYDLYLNNNRLIGEIPMEFGNLSNLREMWLSSNGLTGAIPEELGNLAHLRKLRLRDNQLTGCIPRSLHVPLGAQEIQEIGLPICGATTAATPTPTATSAPRSPAPATPVATPTPTPTSVASNAVMNRLTALETQVAEIPVLRQQIAAMATRIARLEGGSAIAPPTPTHTPTATPIIITGATPSPTPTSVAGATPSPTATRVAGTSGGNACVTRLAGSASVTGSWSSACLSANSPPNDETYYSRFYTFTLDAAARVTITLSSATAAPYLYLLDGAGTDGTVRLSNGDVATSVAITANLPPGAYTIEASTWYSETYGDFTLELEIR